MARKKETGVPESLLEAIKHFADETVAIQYVANLRWPDGKQVCHRCGSEEAHYWLAPREAWKCRSCRKVFSIKVRTIFEGSPIPLSKWLPAMWLLANCKNGISSYELADALDVTQKTAWFMLQRIRLAMQNGSFDKMDGEVEADETFIGGLARNMHPQRRERMRRGGEHVGKVAVMGLLARHGKEGSQVRAKVVKDRQKYTLQGEIYRNVEYESTVYTDEALGYRGHYDFVHQVIDHAERYVDGQIHTNGLENFWSLLKRAIKGTYVSIEPFHLFRYLDEQTFRFNNRKVTSRDRFERLLGSVMGRRLTYDHLTGADRRQYA